MARGRRDDDFLTRPRPWVQQNRGDCPVPEDQRIWVESRMRWLVERFGREAALGELVVAGPELYPEATWTGSDGQVQALLSRIEGVMGVAPGRIGLVFTDRSEERLAARRRGSAPRKWSCARYRRDPDGAEIVEVEREHTAAPEQLAATLAHELAHARLLGEGAGELPDPGAAEELTDLATVFLRMGIVRANAAVSFDATVSGWSARPLGDLSEAALLGRGDFDLRKLGYLDEGRFGYALACLCGVRREPEPAWADSLDPGVRVPLDQSLAYFRRQAGVA